MQPLRRLDSWQVNSIIDLDTYVKVACYAKKNGYSVQAYVNRILTMAHAKIELTNEMRLLREQCLYKNKKRRQKLKALEREKTKARREERMMMREKIFGSR